MIGSSEPVPAARPASPDRAAPLRVGFLIDRWQPERGGAERALAQLAAFLEGRGHQVLAFGARGPSPGTAAPGRFHRVRAFGLTRGARERALGQALVEAARTHACQVTVGVRHLPRVDLYWTQNGAQRATLEAHRNARGRGGRPVVPRGRHRTFLELEAGLLERGGARLVVCVSGLIRDELAQAYPACRPRLRLIPNGVDLDAFHPRARAGPGRALRAELDLPAGVPLLTFPGRDPWRKGLPTLLAALAALRSRPWHLLVAGLRSPSAWMRRAGLPASAATFRAHVDPVALASASDLCLLPTWRDPCGLVVLEALACGTPAITTAAAGAAEALGDAECGTVLPEPGRSDLLQAAIAGWLERLAEKPPDRMRVRAAVADRGLYAWLGAMEAALLELAAPEAQDRAAVPEGGRP